MSLLHSEVMVFTKYPFHDFDQITKQFKFYFLVTIGWFDD